jgi:hypothetical protein
LVARVFCVPFHNTNASWADYYWNYSDHTRPVKCPPELVVIKLYGMKIVIHNNRKIFSIQEEFNQMFPSLKIDFYARPGKPGCVSSSKFVSQSSKTVQDCRAISREGTIEIQPSMVISNLKQNLREIFGLSVEIFQQAGNGSYEFPVSDKRTLEEINRLQMV